MSDMALAIEQYRIARQRYQIALDTVHELPGMQLGTLEPTPAYEEIQRQARSRWAEGGTHPLGIEVTVARELLQQAQAEHQAAYEILDKLRMKT